MALNARRARRWRLGVVGCGRVFERCHLPAVLRSPDFELATVCDVSRARLAMVARTAPSVHVAQNLDELIDGADAVLVASPPGTHREIATTVLTRGLAVLLEKPMGGSIEDARAIHEAVARSGSVLQIGFVRRFRAPYRSLRDICSLRAPSVVRDARSCMVFAPGDWVALSGTLGREDAGGGALFDIASHQVDLVPWLFGSAVRRARVHHWIRNEANERIQYELELEAGQRVECEAAYQHAYKEWLRIVTEDQVALARAYGVHRRAGGRALPSERWLRVLDRAHLITARLPGRASVTAQSFAAQLAAFARALSGERDADRPDATAGLTAHAVLAACRRSRECGGAWEAICVPENAE